MNTYLERPMSTCVVCVNISYRRPNNIYENYERACEISYYNKRPITGKVLSLFQNDETTVWRAIERISEHIKLNQTVCNKKRKICMSWRSPCPQFDNDLQQVLFICDTVTLFPDPILFMRTKKNHGKFHTITNNQLVKVLSLFQNHETTIWRAIERIMEDIIQLNQTVCRKERKI